jgi:sn-glycerol 3-phosphate transport system substrate-binding protein
VAVPEDSQIEAALTELTAVVSANADGNFDETLGEPPTEAVAPLYEAYDELVSEWRDTVGRTASFGEQVAAAATQVDEQVESVRASSREIDDAVADIAAGADEQAERVREITTELQELSATNEEIAAAASEAAQRTTEASCQCTTVAETATEAVSALDSLAERAEATVETTQRLASVASEIDEVVAFVDEVADETNLLALNAKIEAARADDEGDGFGVVASEVKQLAEETQTATSEIESSLEQVHDQVEATVDGIHATGDRVDETRAAVDSVVEELDVVVNRVRAADDEVQEIETATETQAESTQRIVSAVEAVDEIGEETAADASVAVGATRTQTTELAEVSTQVATLSERATTLSSELGRYEATTTDDDTTRVEFWHAMSGETALTLESFAREFESTTTDVEIELVSKGDYRGTFDATLRAAERGELPVLAQLFEIGTTRARKSGAFRPAGELLPDPHVDALLDPVVNYYRYDGRLYSVPFNVSNPVLAYDADAFAAAGLDPEEPPVTFTEVERAARQLVTKGPAEYGITFANYSWFVEQWFTQADEPLLKPADGREGPATTANTDGFAHNLFDWWVGL